MDFVEFIRECNAINRRHRRIVGAISAVISIFLLGFFLTPDNGEDRPTFEESISIQNYTTEKTRFYDYSLCVRIKINGLTRRQEWKALAVITKECAKFAGLNINHALGFENSDEIKYHVIPKISLSDCKVVTLGIGHDTTAEKAFKKTFPECSFVGADPTVTGNREIYEKIGKFVPYAVGNVTEVSKAYVMNQNNGYYHYENVTTQEFVQFLQEHVQSTVVDQILIDIEWGEYGLFEYFVGNGKLDAAGIAVCQFNMEIHSPDSQQIAVFSTAFRRILREHRYIPLNAVNYAGHLRLLFLNFHDERCIKRYLSVENDILNI